MLSVISISITIFFILYFFELPWKSNISLLFGELSNIDYFFTFLGNDSQPCLRRLRHIVMKRFEIIEKFYSSKALLKMAGGECIRSIPHIPPGSAPGCVITKDGLKF